MMNALESTSTRPYLIRALYEWCTDNGLTPYVAVLVDETVKVPMEYVKNGEIVLNISFDATSSLQLGNEFIEFKARFAGTAREIMVPIDRVMAIYARENGQGMAFPASTVGAGKEMPSTVAAPAVQESERPRVAEDSKIVKLVSTEPGAEGEPDPHRPGPAAGGTRPALKRVK